MSWVNKLQSVKAAARVVPPGWFTSRMIAESEGITVSAVNKRLSEALHLKILIRKRLCGNVWIYTERKK